MPEKPERVNFRPEGVNFRPEWANFRSERADFGLKMADFRPERANFRHDMAEFRPERADFRPEMADFRPERADFRSERALGDKQTDKRTNRQMDKRTDGQTKVHLCSTGLRPLWGCCPKTKKKLPLEELFQPSLDLFNVLTKKLCYDISLVMFKQEKIRSLDLMILLRKNNILR